MDEEKKVENKEVKPEEKKDESVSESKPMVHHASKPVVVNSVNKSSSSGFFGKLRENPWIAATIILAIVLIAVLLMGNGGGVNGNVINENSAAQNLIDFISKQGLEAELISVEQDGMFYNIIVEIDGQQVPVSVTSDGKYLVANPIPLTEDLGFDSADTQDQGTQQQVPQDVPKSDKPVVELFIMSHCPYGTQMEKGMIPVVELLGDKIDFELKFVYYAMHGDVEVYEQLNQYCIQEEQNDKFMDYLKCFLEEGDGEACLAETKINMAKLESCVESADEEFSVTANYEDQESWLSGRFPKFDTHLAENEEYGVRGSPTLVINGQEASSARDASSILSTVCGAFNEAPEECDTELTGSSPSPGFGFKELSADSAAATADAQCG